MSPLRILLADDNDTFRHGLRKLLESDARLQVIGEAREGEEAVNMAIRLAPDLVLMDIRMPGQDGLAAARAIRACCPGAKIIILSSHDTPALREEARHAGVHTYLLKSEASDDILHQVSYELSSPP